MFRGSARSCSAVIRVRPCVCGRLENHPQGNRRVKSGFRSPLLKHEHDSFELPTRTRYETLPCSRHVLYDSKSLLSVSNLFSIYSEAPPYVSLLNNVSTPERDVALVEGARESRTSMSPDTTMLCNPSRCAGHQSLFLRMWPAVVNVSLTSGRDVHDLLVVEAHMWLDCFWMSHAVGRRGIGVSCSMMSMSVHLERGHTVARGGVAAVTGPFEPVCEGIWNSRSGPGARAFDAVVELVELSSSQSGMVRLWRVVFRVYPQSMSMLVCGSGEES